MSKSKSGKVQMEVLGVKELLVKLDKLGVKLKPALLNTMYISTKPIAEQMQREMSKHTIPNGKGWSTGATYKSFVNEEVKTKGNNNIEWKIGYSVKKGGLAAIFWNVGGAHINPTYFIDRAADDNLDKVIKKQREMLEERLKELE